MRIRDTRSNNRLNKCDEKLWNFLVESAKIFNPVEISFCDMCISTRMNVFTLVKVVKRLEKMGAIKVERYKQDTNKYTVDLNLEVKEKIDKYSYKAVIMKNTKYKVLERKI